MTRINEVNISKNALKLIKNIINTKPSEEQVIALINELRSSNGMTPLMDENFNFKTVNNQSGQWKESEQKFQLSINVLKTYDILSTIFHEFRHC